MSRDQRKISRSLEERSILASNTRVSQISQTDNELKQKLEAINTSYKLSNKRIKNETRELREILHSLQSELKVSKRIHGQYIPSIFEQPQRRVRRTTVSSVPSEDRKEAAVEQSQQDRSKDRNLNHDAMARCRSGSFPPASHVHDAKKLKDADFDDGPDEILQVKQEPENELKDVFVKKTNSERAQEKQIVDSKNDQISPHAPNKTELWGNERAEHEEHRHVSQAGNQRLLARRSSIEQEQQSGRKKSSTEGSQSFSNVLRGRFITSQSTSLSSSTRKMSRTQQRSEGSSEVGLHRQRPSIVDEYSLAPNQRKRSLGVPQYPWKRKGSTGNRGDSPVTGSRSRFNVHDPESAFDSLPENLGGRRMSVAHGRIRRTSRVTGLPPLKEELKTAQRLQETPAENWSDLAQCRYLRKEEKELGIDDIFGKE